MKNPSKPVIIYTDNPESYSDSVLSSYVNMEFCSCPDKICHCLLEKDYSGLVLDVRKVMGTPCCERNRILSLSSEVPTIRSMKRYGTPIFLDDHEDFICSCLTRQCLVQGSACRVNTSIPVEISLDGDPAMAQSVNGTIHHLSANGCSFHTDANLAGEMFLYLKIFNLKNRLPIFAGVHKEQSNAHCSCGFKVKFLDIKADQREEILALTAERESLSEKSAQM